MRRPRSCGRRRRYRGVVGAPDEVQPVVVLELDEVLPLRRRILREGTLSDDASFPEDAAPGTYHLGIRDGRGQVVAVATLCPKPSPLEPARAGVQLRGMAVTAEHQRQGLGRVLLDAAIRRIQEAGGTVVWASRGTARSASMNARGCEWPARGTSPPTRGCPTIS